MIQIRIVLSDSVYKTFAFNMDSTCAVRLPSNNTIYGHSVDTVASHSKEEEMFESLEEIEAQSIGNLLPDDDDLLSGVTDGLDHNIQCSGGDDMDELDLFSSVGGLDLEDDGLSGGHNCEFPGGVSNGLPGVCNGSLVGEHPYGEHPSRTLFVRNINSNVEDSELRTLFEVCNLIFTFLDYLLILNFLCNLNFGID